MEKILFAKSSKALIDFDVYEEPNSLYGCQRNYIKGFVRIDGRVFPAVAEVYYLTDKYFIRSLQLDGVMLRFSTLDNCFAGPLWIGNTACDYAGELEPASVE